MENPSSQEQSQAFVYGTLFRSFTCIIFKQLTCEVSLTEICLDVHFTMTELRISQPKILRTSQQHTSG